MHIHKGVEIGNSERDVMLEMSFWGTRHLSIFWRVGWGGAQGIRGIRIRFNQVI